MDVDGARVAARVAPLEERSPWRHWLHMEAVFSALLSEHHNHLRPRATAVPRYSLFTQARRRCVLTSCPCSPLNNKQDIAPDRPPRAFPQGRLASLPKGRAIVIGASVFHRRNL